MARYVDGDEAALEEIFKRYAPALAALIARRVRRTEVNDLLQQTFLNFHRARFDFDKDKPLRPWLFTIAMNCVREHLRRTLRRVEHPLDEEQLVSPIELPDLATLEEGQMARARVRSCLQALPEIQREVIELHWFEELSFREIARRLGASLTAVKVRASRGYARLRESYVA